MECLVVLDHARNNEFVLCLVTHELNLVERVDDFALLRREREIPRGS